jgi:hypothetical protein
MSPGVPNRILSLYGQNWRPSDTVGGLASSDYAIAGPKLNVLHTRSDIKATVAGARVLRHLERSEEADRCRLDPTLRYYRNPGGDLIKEAKRTL